MRGHRHESCSRRVLQQGKLVVYTSPPLGQRVTARVRGFRRLNFRLAPEFLISEMLKKAIGILLKSSLCTHQSRAISCSGQLVRPPFFTDFGSETIGGDRYN